MNPLLWLIAFFLFLAFCYRRRIKDFLKERKHIVDLLEKMPGPHALPFLGIAHKLNPDSLLTTYVMEYFFRAHTDSPNSSGVMKLWLGPKPVVILYKPNTIRPVMESHLLVTKPNDYDYLKAWLAEGLLTSSNPKWHSRRKMLTPAFHFSILENFMHCFNQNADILVEKLEKFEQSGYPFDIYPHLKAVALDVICEAAMGVKMNSQQGNNTEYVRSVKVLCELLWLRIRSPWFWPEMVWHLSGHKASVDNALKVVTGFTKKVIAERKLAYYERENNNYTTDDKPAFLDILIKMQQERGLTDEDIREEVDTFMFEGHDTVSNTLSFFLFLMSDARQLPFQDEVYAEMKNIFADDMNRDVTVQDLGKMKYLEQCIKEAMRMIPVVPMVGRIASEDVELEDYTIPKGAAMLITPFLVHRDQEYWTSPNEFEPKHFDPEEVRKRQPFAYIPFSAGARNCIGQKFAMNQLKVVLSKLMRRYRFVGRVHELENRGLPELVMKPDRGCVLRVEHWEEV